MTAECGGFEFPISSQQSVVENSNPAAPETIDSAPLIPNVAQGMPRSDGNSEPEH
jgi:hypothetical protein